ncbi:MAG TPA: hypothetical protein VGG23_10860 [Acidimicrobiales bacterium]
MSGRLVNGRELVRAPARRPTVAGHSPAAGDLYQQDDYARTLLSSLMRAQLGATVTVLVPAAALLLLYPLLAVLFPHLGQFHVAGVPLTFVVLGGGIYPPLVLLGFWYRRRAAHVEQRFVELLEDRDEGRRDPTAVTEPP